VEEFFLKLFVGVLAVYALGRLLLVAYFAARRRHVRNVLRDLTSGEGNGR